MPRDTRYEFTVKGHDPFPIDMLRYDTCWPKTDSPDVINIANSLNPRSSQPVEGREITLVGMKPPTTLRWKDFGWKRISQVTFIGPVR